jgi:hypothetical protein
MQIRPVPSRLLIVEMVLAAGDAPHPGKMLDMVMLVHTSMKPSTDFLAGVATPTLSFKDRPTGQALLRAALAMSSRCRSKHSSNDEDRCQKRAQQ